MTRSDYFTVLTAGIITLLLSTKETSGQFGGGGFGGGGFGGGGFGGGGFPGAGYPGGFGGGGLGLGLGFGLWGGYPGFGFPWLAPPLGFQVNTGQIYGSPGIGFYNPGPRSSYIAAPGTGVQGTGGEGLRTTPSPQAKSGGGAAAAMTNAKGSGTAGSVPGGMGGGGSPTRPPT